MNGVSPAQRRGILQFCAAFLLLGILSAFFLIRSISDSKVASQLRHASRLSPDVPDIGLTAPHPDSKPVRPKVRVLTGCYVDRIRELSIKDAKWSADLYIWLRWRGEAIRPEKGLVLVDATINSLEKEKESTKDGEHYLLLKIDATFTKYFDTTRFPVDDHQLLIELENNQWQYHDFEFVADSESSVSSRVNILGYEVGASKALVKLHSYRSRLGDPSLAPSSYSTFSQFRYVVPIARKGWDLYLKLFIGLFVAVSVAMLTFFIKPTHVDPRFGVGLGALFAAVANAYLTSSAVPDASAFTLADRINAIGIVTILGTLLQSTISLFWFDEKSEEAASRMFDRLAFALLISGYVVINVLLALAAR